MMLQIECIGGPKDGDIVVTLPGESPSAVAARALGLANPSGRMDYFDCVLNCEQPTAQELHDGARLRLGRYILRSTMAGEQYVWIGEVEE